MLALRMTGVGRDDPGIHKEDHRAPDHRYGIVRRVAGIALGLQLAAFLALSTFEYLRFDESHDFGLYMQAVVQIAHGHWNAYGSLIGASFWRNNGEFVIWPLAILYRIIPSPVVLIWLQDAAVVATAWFTFDWTCRILNRSELATLTSRRLALGITLLLTVDPWAWNTIAFDFHTHALTALFLVLTGRDLWMGRSRRGALWAALVLLCGGSATIALAGVGIAAALTCRAVRHLALCISSCALAWFVILTQLHADGVDGKGLGAWYGYLAEHPRGPLNLHTIALGAVTHPGRLLALLPDRLPTAFVFIAVAGIFGLFSPWGLFPAAAVLLPTVFNADPSFLTYTQAFQTWPAIPLVLIGSVSVLTSRQRRSNLTARTRRVLLVAWFAASAPISVSVLSALPSWLSVTAPASAQLAVAERLIPANAEIIGDDGTLGRFFNHKDLYQAPAKWDLLSPAAIPVHSPIVVFLITPSSGRGDPPVHASNATIAFARRLGATTLVARNGIYALEWHVPRGVRSVTLPE